MIHLNIFFCFALIHLTVGQLINLGQGTLNSQGFNNLLQNARTPNNIPSQPYRTLGVSQSNSLARNPAVAGYGQGIAGNRQGIAGNRQGIAGNGQGIAGNGQGIAGNGQRVIGNGLGTIANTNAISGITSIRNTSPYIANAPLANTNFITGKDNTDQLRANLVNSGIGSQLSPSNIGNTNLRNAKVIKYELGISKDGSNIASNIGQPMATKTSGNINGCLANGRQYGLTVDADGLKMVGDVTVNGKLPIYGTVGLNGKLPTKGAGNVEFSC